MPDATTTLATLREALRRFADERSWQPFHSPKNLVMGLSVETAELMEHFLWVDCEASRRLVDDPDKRAEIAAELADAACHLLNLSNSLNIDLSDAVKTRIVKNAEKYPAEKYRGKYKA